MGRDIIQPPAQVCRLRRRKRRVEFIQKRFRDDVAQARVAERLKPAVRIRHAVLNSGKHAVKPNVLRHLHAVFEYPAARAPHLTAKSARQCHLRGEPRVHLFS